MGIHAPIPTHFHNRTIKSPNNHTTHTSNAFIKHIMRSIYQIIIGLLVFYTQSASSFRPLLPRARKGRSLLMQYLWSSSEPAVKEPTIEEYFDSLEKAQRVTQSLREELAEGKGPTFDEFRRESQELEDQLQEAQQLTQQLKDQLQEAQRSTQKLKDELNDAHKEQVEIHKQTQQACDRNEILKRELEEV